MTPNVTATRTPVQAAHQNTKMGRTDTQLDTSAPEQGPDGPWLVRAAGRTDPGRVRPANEDQFLIATLTKALQVEQTSLTQARVRSGDQHGHLFVVADGMGGHAGGEHASALAVDTVESMILNAFKWFQLSNGADEQRLLAEFQGVLRQTDRRVYEQATQNPHLWGMGTTLTLAYSLGRQLYVVHVGDSRAYLYRQGALKQLTRDHTLVQELVRRGHLSPEEASTHKMRHVITNVVGGTEPGVQPDMVKEHLAPGDVLLLCSDGLTDMLSDADIAAALQAEAEPQRACERLVAAANERGGKDNITVVVARYEGQG